MPSDMTIRDVCYELGVSRSWIYRNIDPAVRERCRALDGGLRTKGRAVLYPRELVGSIVAENARAFGFWRPYDFAEKAPDKDALFAALDAPWSVIPSALFALRRAIAEEDLALFDVAVAHGHRRRAKPTEIPMPGPLSKRLRRGDFLALKDFDRVRREGHLGGKSDEMVYRHLYERNMVKVAVFGHVWYADRDRVERPPSAGPRALLPVPLFAFGGSD